MTKRFKNSNLLNLAYKKQYLQLKLKIQYKNKKAISQ